jgi:cytochrome c oxidase assembly protein subunit 15
MKNHPHKVIIIWLFFGCILISAMVVIGGITRLTGSGLSMVEWNVIMGAIPPLNDGEWQKAFDQYKQSPEYQHINFDFSLSDFKKIFFWEYLHRLMGRLIGLVFLIPFIFFWIKNKFDKALLIKMFIILVGGAFQGVLGWYMVQSGLVDNPDVSHYRLAAHLIAAFTVYGYTFWVALDLIYYKRKIIIPVVQIRKWVFAFFCLLILQIIYGAFVAGLDAGKLYNTFPKMGGEWIAQSVTAMKPFYLNLIESRGGVQFIHRCFAYSVFVFAIVLWWKSRSTAFAEEVRTAFNMLLICVLLQLGLGIFTLLYAVPVVLGVLHQLGALMLFTIVIYLLHQLKFQPLQRGNEQ